MGGECGRGQQGPPALPWPQACSEGDFCQEVSVICSKGGTSSGGNSMLLGPGPEPACTPAHLIGLAWESRSAADTWPTRVPGDLFSGTAKM